MSGGFGKLLVLAMASLAAVCLGAENTLKATFENGGFSIEAKGGAIVGKTDSPPAFAKGVEGQGIRLEKNSLSYPSFGNIDINKGALSFWIRPVDWGDSLVSFLPMVALDGGQGSSWQLLLYYVNDNSGKLLDFRMMVSGKREIIAQVPAKSFKQGEWNHIALSWNDMEMRINLNGEKGAFQSYGLPIQRENKERHSLWFMPDDFWRKKNVFTTELDEIRIFDGFITESDVKQLYMAYGKKADAPAAEGTIPRAGADVKIDGRLEKGEWDDASRLPLAVMVSSKTMYSRQAAWVMLKNDGENLLVAFEIEGRITENDAKPNARSNDFKMATLAEVDVPISSGKTLQYFVYPNGAWSKLVGPRADWNAQTSLKCATYITEKGWTAEISIPLSELELKSNVLKANFGIRREDQDIETTDDRWVAWSAFGKELSFLSMAANLTLDAQACRVESFGHLENGIVDFDATKGTSMTVKDLVEGTQKTYQGASKDKLPWAGMSEVSVKGNGISWTTNVVIKELASLKTVCHGNDRVIDFEISLLEGDVKLNKALKEGGLLASISITDKLDKAIAVRDARLESAKTTLRLPFPKLEEGYYLLNLNISGDGINFSTSRKFGVPEMDFIGTREGLEETVPFPWAKPVRHGDTVQTNFHRYDFGGKVFPQKAWSFKQPVLEGTSDFHATVDGKAVTFKSIGKQNDSDTYESLVSSGQLKSVDGKVLVSWRRVIDYDGLVKVDFSVEPTDRSVMMEDFGMEFTIPEEAAKIALTPSIDVSWEMGGSIVNGDFFIGATGKKGFAVFTDNNANFVFPKGGHPFTISRRNGGATIAVRFINGKARLERKAEYTLAVMATPGKPPRADWRRLHGDGWLAYKGQNMAVRGWPHERKNIGFYRCDYMAWPTNPESMLKCVEDYRKRGIDCIPYCTSNMIPDANPLFDYFAKDWERAYHGEGPISSPDTDIDGTKFHLTVPVCQNVPQYRDYLCHYTAKNMDRFGFKGIYFDAGGTTMTNRTFNLIERERVLTPERPVEVLNIFGTRELYKRIYKLIRKRHANGYLFIHNWRNFHPAFMSFVDMANPGEEFMHSFPSNNNVYMNDKEFSSPGLWRYNYSSETMGVAIQFLSGFNFHPRLKEWFKRGLYDNKEVMDEMFAAGKSMVAMCLLHDVPMSGAGYPPILGLWETLDKQDISTAEFHPYWEQNEIKTDNDCVVVSYYGWKGSSRRLIVLGNLKSEPATVKLSGTGAQLSETWPNSAAFNADSIQIDGYSFRLLEEGD